MMMRASRKTQALKDFFLRFLEASHLKKFLLRSAMIAVPYGWHILFFVIPFIIVLKLSFSESIIGTPPYTNLVSWLNDSFLQIRLNIRNYTFIWEDELYIRSYLESLKNAGIATVGCLVMGYPLAYGITRARPLMRIILLMLVILPFWTSFLVRVYSWIGILSNTGVINTFLTYLGIIKEPLPLLNNNFAVILGLVYSYVPFMVLPLYASLDKIDPHYIEAAYDLGCKPFKAFFKIIIPLSSRGIIGGSMLVFIPSVGEYVIPALLGGSNSLMVGRVLWNEFFTNHDWPLASALVVTLFLFLVVPMIVFQRFTREVVEEEEE
jgi:putrescine transport system permease protein